MKRNIAGGPQPSSLAEIIEAMGELDLEPADAAAQLFPPAEDEPDGGWSAEISDAETGAKRIGTMPFPSRGVLENALIEAGVLLIEEAW